MPKVRPHPASDMMHSRCLQHVTDPGEKWVLHIGASFGTEAVQAIHKVRVNTQIPLVCPFIARTIATLSADDGILRVCDTSPVSQLAYYCYANLATLHLAEHGPCNTIHLCDINNQHGGADSTNKLLSMHYNGGGNVQVYTLSRNSMLHVLV